jgi:L-methionine (R)-S-oxide reductase
VEASGPTQLVEKVFYKPDSPKLMAENLYIPNTASKAEIYEALLPQIQAITAQETDLVANLANVTAILKTAFGWLWVGFYLVKGNELVLGPFQGPVACTRIAFGRGVCGHAYTTQSTVIVPNVDAFPGHIACSSASKSEIVVPFFNTKKELIMVLDLDADVLNAFDETDKFYLEQIAKNWLIS